MNGGARNKGGKLAARDGILNTRGSVITGDEVVFWTGEGRSKENAEEKELDLNALSYSFPDCVMSVRID